jgi:hypothetical protein
LQILTTALVFFFVTSKLIPTIGSGRTAVSNSVPTTNTIARTTGAMTATVVTDVIESASAVAQRITLFETRAKRRKLQKKDANFSVFFESR